MATRKKLCRVCAADIGNSRIKLSDGTKFYALNGDDIKNAVIWKEVSPMLQGKVLIYSSVNKKLADLFLTKCRSIVQKAFNAANFVDNRKFPDMAGIIGMGIDRILGMSGALEFYKPPLITVDTGTAITINGVNRKYACVGGAILPGIYTQMKSLSGGTDQLESTELFLPDKSAGNNTEDALRSGIVIGTAGAILEICRRIKEEEFNYEYTRIIFSGTYYDVFSKNLQNCGFEIHHRKNIVIDGIFSIAKEICEMANLS